MLELQEFSLTTYTFFICSCYLILMSYYYQYKNILYYSNINKNTDFFNKDLIYAQLNGLEQDFHTNKYVFWSYSFSIISVTILIFLFNLGNHLKYILLFISIFLFIQYIIEFKFFLLKILAKRNIFSIDELLNQYEINRSYEKINLTEEQISKLKAFYEKNLKKNDIIKIDNDLIYFINDLFNEENIRIEKSLYGVSFRNSKYELIEYDKEENSFFFVKEEISSYSKSFYEISNFERLFFYGMLEPMFISILLFSILILK